MFCALTADVNRLRRRAAMPNGAIIKMATVTSSEADKYTVTLVPYECGDKFPLFELENSQVQLRNLYFHEIYRDIFSCKN